MATTFSSVLRHSLVKQTYYLAILIGIISINFDIQRKKIHRSKYLSIYAIICNIAVVLTAPIVQFHVLTDTKFYLDNMQMKLINSINLNLQYLAAVMTLVLRWKRECVMEKIIRRFFTLEEEYFERVAYPQQLVNYFERLFFSKYISIWLQNLISLYIVYRYVTHVTVWWYVSFVYVVIILNILHGVIMHYYMCLLYVGSRFYIINYRLTDIFNTLHIIQAWSSRRSRDQMQKALAAEMDCITYVHCILMNIVTQLNDAYKFQILTVLLTHLFNNTALGYYGVMMCLDFSKFNISYYDIGVASFSYCCLVLDLYLVDLNCHTIQITYERTGALLKKFCDFNHLVVSLEKSCDLLSLHLAHKKLFIDISGMFNLNRSNSFIIFGFTIRQVLILVQNDVATSIRYLTASRELSLVLIDGFKKALHYELEEESD